MTVKLEKGQFFESFEILGSHPPNYFEYTNTSTNIFDMLLALISFRITYQFFKVYIDSHDIESMFKF